MITWFKRAVGTAPAKSSDRLDETPDFLAVEDAEATAVETAPPAPPPPARKPPPAPSPAGKPAAPEAAMPQAEAPAAEGRLRAVAKGGAAAFRSDQKSLYRELLKGMYDAVLVTDPKGHVIDSNPRVADILLYPAADIWDMPIEKLVRGLTPPMLERIRQTVAGNRHVLLDATCRRRDGTTFAAEVAISRLNLINEGDFVFFIRNVERRRQTMQRLRRGAVRLQTVPNSPCRAVLRSLGLFARGLTGVRISFDVGLDITSPILLHFHHESAHSDRF